MPSNICEVCECEGSAAICDVSDFSGIHDVDVNIKTVHVKDGCVDEEVARSYFPYLSELQCEGVVGGESDGGWPIGAVIGIVIVLFLVLILLSAAAYLAWSKRRRQEPDTEITVYFVTPPEDQLALP